MNPQGDTLHIQPLAPDSDLPIAEVERFEPGDVEHPEAAARARARIAELTTEAIDPVIDSMLPPLITDKAVLAEQLQAGKHPLSALPARPVIPSRFQPLMVAVGIFLLTLLAFKAPVIYDQLHYNGSTTPVTIPANAANAVAPVSSDPTIIISKINVNAPVVYLNSTNETDVLAGLENGVVHYANTALPGQNGNTVFFGHSSNDWWEPGNYKFVFVLLDKLTVGDTFIIDYQSKRYVYQVTNTQIVDPTDVGVLDQTSTPTATLITCSPPGTSWKRLVVSAKQISPSPSDDTASTTQTTATATSNSNNSLPGNSPGLLDQLGQDVSNAWHSIFGGKTQNNPSTTSNPNVPAGTPSQLPDAD